MAGSLPGQKEGYPWANSGAPFQGNKSIVRTLMLLRLSVPIVIVGLLGIAAGQIGTPAPVSAMPLAAIDRPDQSSIEPVYYYHGTHYPYRYNGHYYHYRYSGRYYNHRYYRHGHWHYY